MNDAWRHLKVGDQIRITHIPDEFNQPGYRFSDSTRRLYNRLIAEKVLLTVDRIDEWEIPWVDYEWVMDDGKIEYHTLAVDDTSWVLLKTAFIPPGHHPLDQGRGSTEPVDYQLERLYTYLRWNREHFSSFKKYRESDPETAERELQFLEDTIEKGYQHLKRLMELLRAGYQATPDEQQME